MEILFVGRKRHLFPQWSANHCSEDLSFFITVRLEIVCNENVAYLRFFATVAGNKRSFSHVNFRDGDRKRQNSRNKLPEYRSYVANDVKQSDLNGANLLYCFHHVTKSSERE